MTIFAQRTINTAIMPTVKAFIRTTNKEKAFVNVRFRLTDGRQVQMFHKSDIQVNPNDFDPNKETIKAKIIFDSVARKQFNNSITDRKALITDIYTNAPDGTDFTTDWLELEIDKQLHPEKYVSKIESTVPDTVLAYIRYFNENIDNRKDRNTGRLISSNTKKQYITTEKHVMKFAEYQKKSEYLFNEINQKFYDDFVEYLTNKEYTVKTRRGAVVDEKQQYTINSVGKYIRALKVMISSANNTDADVSKFRVFNEDVDNAYLDETELQQLKDYDFSDSPHLDRVRDWFLLLAWTGSRFSDLQKINPANIKNGMIRYNQQKTGIKVVIPLHPVVSDILEKYSYQIPEPISNQKFNDYIKYVCQAAKIDNVETVNRTIGGKTVSETAPKYSFVSSHTGRRSFCTNMYLRGLDTLTIRSTSGHKTEKSFLKYIKVSEEEHAERMAQKWSEIYK